MRIEIDGDTIVLKAPTNSSVLVKQIPGCRYDKARTTDAYAVWTLPLSWGTCVTARGVLGDRLEVGPKLAAWAADAAKRNAVLLELRDAPDLPTDAWRELFTRVEGVDG